jgi:hypothetical protein
MFALTFLIWVAANKFQLYEGNSEWRSLVDLAIQVPVAIAMIYILCLTLPERIPLLTVTQAVLYVDAAFLFILAIVSIPISYLDFTLGIPAANRELDLFATEQERCLSDNSIFFWLIRGDIKWFLYADRWKPQDWANWLFDNYIYVVILPFLPIFALTLRPKRKISLLLICVFTAIAFVTTVAGLDFIKGRLLSQIAIKDSKCRIASLDQVINKYAPNLIARQIAYKLNNESLKAYAFFAPLSVLGTDFVFVSKLKPDTNPSWKDIVQYPLKVRQSYCSDSVYWVAARRINYGLLVLVNDHDDKSLHRQQFAPKDCPAWPASNASR